MGSLPQRTAAQHESAEKTTLHFVHDTLSRPSIPLQHRHPGEIKLIREHIVQHNRRQRRELNPRLTQRAHAPIGWLRRTDAESTNREAAERMQAQVDLQPHNDRKKVSATNASKRSVWVSQMVERKTATTLTFCPDFIQTSGFSLTQQEKNLLGDYSCSRPSYFAGNHSQGPFCAWRDLQWRVAWHFPFRLHWMLLLAEYHKTPQSQSAHFFSRKAMAYRKLKNALSDETQQRSNETMDLLMCVTLMDSAMSSPDVGRIHLLGLYRLIQHRGGLVSLFDSPSVMFHPIMIIRYFLSAPLVTSDYKDLSQTTMIFVEDLRSTSFRRSSLSLHNSALREILRTSWPPTYLHQRRLYFATVHLLLLILNVYSDSSSFLSYLDNLIQLCGSHQAANGLMVTKLAALPGLIGKAWIDVGQSHDDTYQRRTEVSITAASLEGIKIFSLLEAEMQSHIILQLVLMLFDDVVHQTIARPDQAENAIRILQDSVYTRQ